TNTVDVPVTGGSELRLVVTNGGDNIDYDHADWALARVECGSSGGDTTPPTVTGTTPASGATGGVASVSPTLALSQAVDPATITPRTFTFVQQGQSTPLAAAVSYTGQVATLDPNADLQATTTYTATVKGGASGAKDVAGNPLATDFSWSFTTAGSANQP